MDTQQSKTSILDQLGMIQYARKKDNFLDASDTQFRELDPRVQEFIQGLPVLHFKMEDSLMDINSLDGDQQYYLFTTSPSPNSSPGYYLVDNQGYDYPRYITRLWGYAEDEVVTGRK